MVAEGMIMLTPYDPPGRVRVLFVTEPDPEWPWCGLSWARVVHVEDHPHGYKTGTTGWYEASALRPVDEAER